MKKQITITWDDFDKMAYEIAMYYRNKDIKKIVGISRGGLPLAVKLSHYLDVPMIPLVWSTRDYCTTQIDKIEDLSKEEGLLFVDDICDSGRTIHEIQSYIPNCKFTTITTKQWNLTDFSPMQIQGDNRWVTFPWENSKITF